MITCSSNANIQTKFGNIAKKRTDSTVGDNWNDLMQGTIREGKGDGFCARIKCLVLASAVYFVWHERSCRIVKDARHSCEYVLSKINKNVREVTWYWRARGQYRNWAV